MARDAANEEKRLRRCRLGPEACEMEDDARATDATKTRAGVVADGADADADAEEGEEPRTNGERLWETARTLVFDALARPLEGGIAENDDDINIALDVLMMTTTASEDAPGPAGGGGGGGVAAAEAPAPAKARGERSEDVALARALIAKTQGRSQHWKGFTCDELDVLAREVSIVSYDDGERVMRTGEAADFVALILSGAARVEIADVRNASQTTVSTNSNTKRRVAGVFGPGSLIGRDGAVGGRRSVRGRHRVRRGRRDRRRVVSL